MEATRFASNYISYICLWRSTEAAMYSRPLSLFQVHLRWSTDSIYYLMPPTSFHGRTYIGKVMQATR